MSSTHESTTGNEAQESLSMASIIADQATMAKVGRFMKLVRQLENGVGDKISTFIPSELQILTNQEAVLAETMAALRIEEETQGESALKFSDYVRYQDLQYLSAACMRSLRPLAHQVEKDKYLLQRLLRAGYQGRPNDSNDNRNRNRLIPSDIERALKILKKERGRNTPDKLIAVDFCVPPDSDDEDGEPRSGKSQEKPVPLKDDLLVFYRERLSFQTHVRWIKEEGKKENVDVLDNKMWDRLLQLIDNEAEDGKLCVRAMREWRQDGRPGGGYHILKCLDVWAKTQIQVSEAYSDYQEIVVQQP